MFTFDQFRRAVPKALKRDLEKYYPYLESAMHQFEVDTPNRVDYLIAQVAHESMSFYTMEELASGRAYERRADLGNLMPEALRAAHAKGTTTGRFYKGHGAIQVTGYFNHKACGEALGLDLVNEPLLLTVPEHAVRSACWYFQRHGCNAAADKDDFRLCTKLIVGGYTGYDQRLRHLGHVRKAFR